jgi:DNA repair exonuclease SbcCD ATPase subunit
MYQPPMGSGAGRNVPIFPSHQQGSGGGDGSNNLFAGGERGVWAYVQTLEDKVKQLSDKVQAMEAEKKTHRDQVTSQQEQINQLSEELFSLRGNLSTQNQAQRPPASGPS